MILSLSWPLACKLTLLWLLQFTFMYLIADKNDLYLIYSTKVLHSKRTVWPLPLSHTFDPGCEMIYLVK